MYKLTIVLLLAPSVALAKPSTLAIDAGNGTLALTFDPKKISEAELRAAATLAPDSGPDAFLTLSLESCYDAAGKDTAPCGTAPHTPAQPVFFRDADLTIARNREIVKTATERTVPAELEPAKAYLRRQLAFWAGLEDHKLAFYRSWKTADLAGAIEGIDGAKSCAAAIAKIDAAAAKDDKYRLVRFDWHNCMNDLGHKTFGAYPAAPWKAFLKAKGVKAKFTLPEGD